MIESRTLTDQLNYHRFKDHDKVVQFRNKLREFADEYLSKHIYMKASSIAKDYLAHRVGSARVYPENYNTLIHRLTRRFSTILIKFKELGLIEKYNSKQYKKVRKHPRVHIEIPNGYNWECYRRDKLDIPKPIRLRFIDGKFMNSNFYS